MSVRSTVCVTFLLVCVCVISNVYAEPISVYGRANVSLQLADEGQGSFSELSSNASRIGVKGDEEIEREFRVIYQLEWEVNLAHLSDSDNLKARDQYLGLSSSWGTVYLGRKNTFTKVYSQQLDVFNDYQGDIKNAWKGENRLAQSLSYESVQFSDFQLGISYQAKETEDGEEGVSLGLRYGDSKLKTSDWNAAVTIDHHIAGYDILRASLQAKLNNWTVGGIVHQQSAVGESLTQRGYLLSAQYHFTQWTLKTQWQTLEDNDDYSLGVDYQLAKSSKVYGWYTRQNLPLSNDQSWLAVGIELRF